MSKERYKECKELNDKRTQGEWAVDKFNHLQQAWFIGLKNSEEAAEITADIYLEQDAKFIAHAPKMFELLTEYKKLLEEAGEALSFYGQSWESDFIEGRGLIVEPDQLLMRDEGDKARETLIKLNAATGETENVKRT